ncbi:unnamed protein product [Arabidopsis lyrata]|uniref:Predicted protein n=1 Tax=Arabidopsis lyrata subsp. lyrata TaxID=81972 RepID=D7KST7_ARALL|nr:predicted protein [Arabidopsis lyrata subsp. lyrata]CAH8255879.1 unnamed protein product [Arabidopsis lyrata]
MSLRLVECRSGSISLQIFGSTVRRAPPPTKRSSSYFAVSYFLVFFPSRVNRLSRVKPMVVVSSTSLSGALRPLLISVVGDPLASVNRRRRRMSSSSLGLGQSPTLQFQWKGFNWAWPIFGPSGGCCGPLLFGLQACFVMQTSFLACPNVVHFSPSAPTTDFVFPRLTFGHAFTISDFFTHRFTGYFFGFPLPTLDTSPVDLGCFWFRTTFVGSDSAQIRRRLITGYCSGVPLPVSLADPGCSQPRTTFVGLHLNGYSVWCFVTSFLTANFRIDLVALVADSISRNIALCVFCVVQGVISLLRSSVIKVQGRHDDDYCLGDMIALIYPSIYFSFMYWFAFGSGSLIALAPPFVTLPSFEDD